MDASSSKYFDYMDRYGVQLQSIFEHVNLEDDLIFWRTHGIAQPSAAASWCRKTLEGVVDHLLDGIRLPKRASLDEKLQIARDEERVDKGFYYKYDQIRRTGNDGTHKSVQVIEATMCMDLLDEVLYDLLFRLGFANPPKMDRKVKEDSAFYSCDPREADDLADRARTAAMLSGDSSIEERASQVVAEVEKNQLGVDQAISQIAQIISNLEDDNPNKEAIQSQCDGFIGSVQRIVAGNVAQIQEIRAEVEEIISEHDFIKKLLAGREGGEATDEQLDVMAFPKSEQAATTMLLLRGNAGTGKTLCLLAKLIKQLESCASENEAEDPEKKALFVCFNKKLSDHVDDLMRGYPQARERIHIVSFDKMVNHLVKSDPDDKCYFKDYGSDVRYGRRWNILYEPSQGKAPYQFIQQAMEEVSKRHPQKRGVYYLNYASEKDAAWVKGEIDWLEAKYDSLEHAAVEYPKAARTGRTAERRPNAEARAIILEILSSYHSILEQGKRYTIEQAMKRLLASEDLPKYDAIAIDEVQDLSILAIKTILKMRKDANSWVYIAGDEDQKIYQRDFTWKELGDGARGYTITLTENKRNIAAVEVFASRLTGGRSSLPENMDGVTVARMNEFEVKELVAELRHAHPGESIAYIGYSRKLDPGVCVSYWQPKGLEYDSVIVDCSSMVEGDIEAEKRLRYVHFTRARKRLYVVYRKNPSEILTTYYWDFL